MNRFTITAQQSALAATKPRTWGWRFLFKALIEIQHNQQEQIKLLKALDKHIQRNDMVATNPDDKSSSSNPPESAELTQKPPTPTKNKEEK